MASRSDHRLRRLSAPARTLTGALTGALMAALMAALTGALTSGPAAAGTAAAVPTTAGPTAAAVPRAARGETIVATVRRTAPRYARPGLRARGTVPATWYGRRSVLPVIASRPGWVRVRLAQRPNGSTAWLPARYVTFGVTPYRIVIHLATTHLALYRGGRRVLNAPAGVGAPDDPTPRGRFFVAFTEPPPERAGGYGPFILVTSAHSPKIKNWAGSGDAVIGIHGPLGADRAIGRTGARISHGCVRLHLAALLKLRHVPPGTPIDVTR